VVGRPVPENRRAACVRCDGNSNRRRTVHVRWRDRTPTSSAQHSLIHNARPSVCACRRVENLVIGLWGRDAVGANRAGHEVKDCLTPSIFGQVVDGPVEPTIGLVILPAKGSSFADRFPCHRASIQEMAGGSGRGGRLPGVADSAVLGRPMKPRVVPGNDREVIP